MIQHVIHWYQSACLLFAFTVSELHEVTANANDRIVQLSSIGAVCVSPTLIQTPPH